MKVMADEGDERQQQRLAVVFIALQVGIPAALMWERITTGVIHWYGWGWQMYSL